MENKIPVPTDNIFKFYALFGLLLFIFSAAAFIYVNKSANETVMVGTIEVETLKAMEKPSRAEVVRREMLERKIQITLSDKKFFFNALGAIAGISIIGMVYGFGRWHTSIQPMLDDTAKAQLDIAQLQREKLRRELGYAVELSPAHLPATTDRGHKKLSKLKKR